MAQLDHINIIAEDLNETAQFYAWLLTLERRDAPPPMTRANAQWMYDRNGRAIIHINSVDCPRTYDRPTAPGPTGAIHHVALSCTDYAGMIERLETSQKLYRTNVVAAINLRQIFTLDPNGVLLELNFRQD